MGMLVDSNEKNSIITDILNDNGIQTEIKQLQVGDYSWNDIVVERKEINDFISSVYNNHLYDQLEDIIYNLNEGASRGFLIMHGNVNDIKWKYLEYLNITGFYRHLGDVITHNPKVSFCWVNDEYEFATLLTALYHQSFVNKKEHFPFVKKTKRNDVNVLIATKHFSVAQAKRILKDHSLRQIFNMDLEEMIKIKGFGKVGVGKFIKFRGKK